MADNTSLDNNETVQIANNDNHISNDTENQLQAIINDIDLNHLSDSEQSEQSANNKSLNNNDNALLLSDEHILLLKLQKMDFGAIDSNENHLIEKEELLEFFESNSISIGIVDLVFETIDSNNDGSISPKEYFQWRDELTLESLTALVSRANVSKVPSYIHQGSTPVGDITEMNLTQTSANDRETTPENNRQYTSDTQVSDVSSLTFTLESNVQVSPKKDSGLLSSIDEKKEREEKEEIFLEDPLMQSQANFYQQQLYKQQSEQFESNEYACVQCNRAVSNNVFMEKEIDECSALEINFEVERLLCCLHYLSEECNIYRTLHGYLTVISKESEENNISSPFHFSQSQEDNREHMEAEETQKIVKSETAHHIQWLHEAAMTDRETRLQNKKGKLITQLPPPSFERLISKKKKLKQLYPFCRDKFCDTVNVLHDAFLLNNNLTASNGRQAEHESMTSASEIKKLETYSGGFEDEADDIFSYSQHKTQYDALYSCTPTKDEMACYLALCRVIFEEHPDTNNLSFKIGEFQKLRRAILLLRQSDHAIADQTDGWVTSIDNILCVLLYRNMESYSDEFMGELQLSFVLEGAKHSSLANFEDRNLLHIIKSCIVFAYNGLPSHHDELHNDNLDDGIGNKIELNTNQLILRKKEFEKTILNCCSENNMIRLTFGIQVTNARNKGSASQIRHYPFKFLVIAKHLFEIIHKKQFVQLFARAARQQQVQIKIHDIHTYDLNVMRYHKGELHIHLHNQFAGIPNTEMAGGLQISSTHSFIANSNDPFSSPVIPNSASSLGADTLTRSGTTRRHKTIDEMFVHAFDTNNIHQHTETMLSDDFGREFETQFVNLLKKLDMLFDPSIIYTKLSYNELNEVANKKKAAQYGGDGDVDPDDRAIELAQMGAMTAMDRGISSESTRSFTNVLTKEEMYRSGHRICLTFCNLTLSMVLFAMVMAFITGLGGYYVYAIGKIPMEPTCKNIISFTDRMLQVESSFMSERAWFSAIQFVDFTQLVSDMAVMDRGDELYDEFLTETQLVSPRFDGIIIVNSTSSVVVLKVGKDDNKMICTCNDDIGTCDCTETGQKATQSESLYHATQTLWHSDHDDYMNDTQHQMGFVLEFDDNSSPEGLWFVTFYHNTYNDIIVGGMFQSSRIDMELNAFTLSKGGMVYWMTYDDYGDVFVTSLSDNLYITEHGYNTSSIALDSTYVSSDLEDEGNLDDGIKVSRSYIMDLLGNGLNKNDSLIEIKDYYVYYSEITVSDDDIDTFGSFLIVIVYPLADVYSNYNTGVIMIWFASALAIVLAMANACLANAVPLIPKDDSWLAQPLFTENDKKEIKDNMEIAKSIRDNGEQEPQRRVANAPPPLKSVVSVKEFKPMVVQEMPAISSGATSDDRIRLTNDNTMSRSSMDQGDKAYKRQRSRSIDMGKSKKGKKKTETKEDAIARLTALSNDPILSNDNDAASVALKKGMNSDLLTHAQTDFDMNSPLATISSIRSNKNKNKNGRTSSAFYGNDDSDDSSDEGPMPGLNKAVSVATGKLQILKSRKRRNTLEVAKREYRAKVTIYKNKQKREKLKKNINHAVVQSMFSRQTEHEYKTAYAQKSAQAIQYACGIIALLIVMTYYGFRVLTETDISSMSDSYLTIASDIMENHVEFAVYQNQLVLQQGQILLSKNYTDSESLHSFYGLFDDLTGVFTLNPNNETGDIMTPLLYATSPYGNDEECIKIDEIVESPLADCITFQACDNSTYDDGNWTDINDCIMYQAMVDTYSYYINSTDTPYSYSLPFACLNGDQVCFVSITSSDNGYYIGTLLSMSGVSSYANEIIWEKSEMQKTVDIAEKTETAYSNTGIEFSYYLFAAYSLSDSKSSDNSIGYFLDKYDIESDYLLSATESDNSSSTVVQKSSAAYSVSFSSVMSPNESSNLQVQSSYNYLKTTKQIKKTSQSEIAHSLMSYPTMTYFWHDTDIDGMSWVAVVTLSSEIFLGDHNVYATLGSVAMLGWGIVYAFVHFLIYRRFEENIAFWEARYLVQIEEEMFPILDESEDVLTPNTDEMMDGIDNENDGNHKPTPNNMTNSEETKGKKDFLEYISQNIRETVRTACQESWIRSLTSANNDLPTKRLDITDHYHRRALEHIYQAKHGMNIITVVQMESSDSSKLHRLRLYEVHSSKWCLLFVQLIIIIHIALVFWRPLTSAQLDKGYSTVPLVIEWICIFVEMLDLILGFFIQFRWQRTADNPLMSPSQMKRVFCFRVLFWFLILVDVILIMTISYSFSVILPIRPMLLILSNDKLIGAIYSLIQTAITAVDVLLLISMLWCISAAVGTILFRVEGSGLMDVYNLYGFQNFIRSGITSWVFIISGENYTEIVYDSVQNEGWATIIYFVSLTFLGSFIVVSLVVSRFQTSFKKIYSRERTRRQYFKRTGYVAAFSLINLDNDSTVSRMELNAFVRYLEGWKEGKHELAKLDWQDLDADGDGKVDILEFVSSLEEIYQKPNLIDIINSDNSLLSWIRLNIVEQESFSQAIVVITLIELILLTMFGIYPGTASIEMLDLMLGITVLLNALDIAVKIGAMSWDYYWNTSSCRIINVNSEDEISIYTRDPKTLKQREFAHRSDLVVVVTAILLFVGSRIFVRNLVFDDEENAIRLVMIIPLFRLFTLIKTTRSAVYTIKNVLPRFASLAFILLIVFYMYAIWGVQIIGDDLKYLLDKPQYSFNTFGQTLLVLFQLTVGEGWHDIMYASITAKNSFINTAIYFLSFVFLVTLIFTNLFVGLVLSVVDDIEKENDQKTQEIQKYNDDNRETSKDDDDNDNNKDDLVLTRERTSTPKWDNLQTSRHQHQNSENKKILKKFNDFKSTAALLK